METGFSSDRRNQRDRRVNVVDHLYRQMTMERRSFWEVVYPLYMTREITNEHLRQLVRMGLEDARGNYKLVTQLFSMRAAEYKKFLNFLRKHNCQPSFLLFRTIPKKGQEQEKKAAS